MILTYWSEFIITDGVVIASTARQHQRNRFLVRQVCVTSPAALHVSPADSVIAGVLLEAMSEECSAPQNQKADLVKEAI